MNAQDAGAVFGGKVRLMDERETTSLAPDGLGRLICLYELGGASVPFIASAGPFDEDGGQLTDQTELFRDLG